jgi:hypothetical protein
MSHFTMTQCLVLAMRGRGPMSNGSIYRETEKVCSEHDRELPHEWKAEIRQNLQAHCPSRRRWNRKDDFFVWHKRSLWSCKISEVPGLITLAGDPSDEVDF